MLLQTAPSPSGKAEVCKTSISGSNPDGASNSLSNSVRFRFRFPAKVSPTVPEVSLSARRAVRGRAQVAVRHDVVAVEHAARLVAGELHRDAFRYAAANHVPDGGSPEVVRNAPGTPGREARRLPCRCERANRLRILLASPSLRDHANEHPRHHVPSFLQPLVCLVLCLEKFAQVIGERKDAPVSVLRRFRLELAAAAQRAAEAARDAAIRLSTWGGPRRRDES